jgi:acyl-CoA synthetase (NDP forming)
MTHETLGKRALTPTPHRLDPLLRPASIAVLGASERAGTVGSQVIENLQLGGFNGPIYAVNPGRDSVHGLRCFKSLSELPETVEQVIFALADTRVEAALEEVIAHGAKSAVMYSTLVLDNDTTPALRERVGQRVRESGLLLAGANGMGFYNFHDGVWACGFDTRHNHIRGGNVTLISHSGSGMSGILDCEERIDFNLAVSTGQELSVRMDDYTDFAIECLDTRAIGLFMETARNPEGLKSVLEKAARKGIPVVALKVGRTELAARLTVSHSGALAGTDAAYQALFDRYGVQRVEDMDEMATALIMFAQPHRVGAGGLVGLHDSGGERQLLIDLADRTGVELTTISPATTKKLEDLLDPGLPAVNPLDAWSTGGPDYHLVMGQCFAALMSDPLAALGAVVHDRAPHGEIYRDYIDYLRAGHAVSGKPVFLVANRQGTGSDPLVQQATREGFPVLDGLRSFLVGTRCLLRHRDFQARIAGGGLIADRPGFSAAERRAASRWMKILAQGETLDEFDSLELLRDFGLPTNPSIVASTKQEVLAAAAELDYPLALKSAQPGLLHKSDRGGVVLNLRDDQQLLAEYQSMSERLGPEVLLSRMVPEGVEMVLGVVRDDQFGPLVMLGFGGIHVETLKDVAFALPPFSAEEARRLVDGLKLRALLDGVRGQPPADVDAYCEAASKLSQLACLLGDAIGEIDINPLILGPRGCVAVDALVSGQQQAGARAGHGHEYPKAS